MTSPSNSIFSLFALVGAPFLERRRRGRNDRGAHTTNYATGATLVASGPFAPSRGSKDLFVHHSNIAGEGFKSLAEGARVSYEEREGAKGPEATNVASVA